MEKIGIEIEAKQGVKVKTADSRCEHPAGAVQTDGEVRFCSKCEKYISPGKASK